MLSIWKVDGCAQDACLFLDPTAKTQTNQLINLLQHLLSFLVHKNTQFFPPQKSLSKTPLLETVVLKTCMLAKLEILSNTFSTLYKKVTNVYLILLAMNFYLPLLLFQATES